MSPSWKKPRTFNRNLVVIGDESAGLVSALVAAKTGAKVTLIEANEMGTRLSAAPRGSHCPLGYPRAD
jgi:NADPH-dependent 2,4-dienoyl-CoA reductase/sulfur reductase-like enzyme